MPTATEWAELQRSNPGVWTQPYRIAHRISDRFEPKVQAAFLRSVDRLIASTDPTAIRTALASGNLSQIEAAAGAQRLAAILAGSDLGSNLELSTTVTGTAGADALGELLGVEVSFNARHPNTVLFARTQTARLVVAVGEEVKEAIRIITAAGADIGLTTTQQARAIREIVGLPPNWAAAPANLADDLRNGRVGSATSRRLSAVDKAKIRSRIAAGTVTEEFVEEMMSNYTRSLTNRRALNIARTETLRAAHGGQRESWRQAADAGVIPRDVRRHWIVTPDERLREEHAAVIDMNPEGVGLDEPFETPLGPVFDPPLDVLCRCGVGLEFTGGSR